MLYRAAFPPAKIAERVRDRLRADGIDPTFDRATGERLARAEVRRHRRGAGARGRDDRDEDACVREVLATVAGYGPLQPYLDDPTVEEVWLNAPDRVFIARGGRPEQVPLALTESAVHDLVERMLHATGRRDDLSKPVK